MRRFLAIAALIAAAGAMFAQGGSNGAAQGEERETKIINLKSDITGPVAPGDSVIFLVGNFAAQHNGAVITCDSAVRYSDMHIEFFGNVLINKNTTYIYGERADYNGEINEARVYSDLVKVVDGDATLYTYKFLFNTKENIGEFDEGGILINRENLLEAIRGYYYADTKELICVDRVEMRNDEYELKGDSVVYNMASDNAYFFDKTNIWNNKGEYLYADRGSYDKADSLYVVTRNGYILTEKQEIWSDSIDYYRPQEHVILRHDIQIDETEHKALAFGEYGEYWKEPGNAFLTQRPAVVNYDLSQGDSLFMRADTMWLFTRSTLQDAAEAAAAAADSLAARTADSLAAAAVPVADSVHRKGTGARKAVTELSDSLEMRKVNPESEETVAEAADSLQHAQVEGADSVARMAADTVQLTPAEQKARFKEAARKAKVERKAAAAQARKEKLAKIAEERKAKNTAKLLAQKEKEEERLAARKRRAEAKLRSRAARAARKGVLIPIDSSVLYEIDSLMDRNLIEQDSLLARMADSLATDSLAMLLPADSTDSLAAPGDSVYRLIKGYRNVRMYRSDFQTVCDSLVAISTDSTIHLFIEPVLWNQNNQIVSEVMDIFTKNQQIVRAEFVGSPMMSSELDTLHYNQVAGKQMTAYFHNNEIYRNDVNGNAQTIYYMQDGEGGEITGMMVIESGNITFFIEDKQVVNITYRINPVYSIYPMDKIPPDQELFLKGFKWEGKRRPAQADVFDRRIRPSKREEISALRRPDFPIVQRIEEHKARLIDLRRWADRSEKVDEATVEWMRMLGYEVGQPRESSESAGKGL